MTFLVIFHNVQHFCSPLYVICSLQKGTWHHPLCIPELRFFPFYRHPVSIKWTKRGKDLTETRRRLVLSEVSKKRDGGTYECHAELRGKGRKIVIPYVLNVIGRNVIEMVNFKNLLS